MKSFVSFSVGLLVGTACATAASAAPFVHFEAHGPTPSASLSFDIPLAPKISHFTDDSFTIENVSTGRYDTGCGCEFTVPFDYTFFLSDPIKATSGGTVFFGDVLSGPQLFTGATAAPVFKLGGYTVASVFNPDESFDINITLTSDPSAAPEPVGWALLVLGFGAIGGGLRYKHRRAFSSNA